MKMNIFADKNGNRQEGKSLGPSMQREAQEAQEMAGGTGSCI